MRLSSTSYSLQTITHDDFGEQNKTSFLLTTIIGNARSSCSGSTLSANRQVPRELGQKSAVFISALDIWKAHLRPSQFEIREDVAIPFYVYDDPPFRQLNTSCGSSKHGDHRRPEFYFNRDVQSHPWRVQDPNDALLFIVPLPWDSITREECSLFHELLPEVVDILEHSPWMKRNRGSDHFTAGFNYRFGFWLDNSVTGWETPKHKLKKMVLKMITGTILHLGAKGVFCSVCTPYKIEIFVESERIEKPKALGELVSLSSISENSPTRLRADNKTVSFSLPTASYLVDIAKEYLTSRKYTFGFAGQADNRPAYTWRRIAIEKLPGFMSPNFLVNTLRSVPAGSKMCSDDDFEGCTMQFNLNKSAVQKSVKESKFCLFFRGDTWESPRLFECIAGGAVPLVISDGALDIALPLQCEVDWELLSVQIPQAEFGRDPRGALSKYMPKFDTEEDLINLGLRILEVRRAQPIVLYNHPESVTSCEYPDYSKLNANWRMEMNEK